MKRTYQPNVRRRKRKHGFRARMSTRAGRAILKRRRARGRKRLSACRVPRHRLSRSRDFDAVYRHGRSVSTRYLVLYWFAREDDGAGARLGLAVPKAVGTAVVRNRVKRRLKEIFYARSEELPQNQDYVLVVRPGLAEAAESRGHEWLTERLEEILGKAAA